MDRFKFRVYNTKRKCYEDARKFAIDSDGILYEFKHGLKPVNMDIRVIEQCTGLKDSNGKLIYEGDIFDIAYNIGTRHCQEAVEYDSHGSGFSPFTQPEEQYYQSGWGGYEWERAHPDECEVIGNIHEHPHLLEA
jgi:uncharacterized phage protein (TIGR01671 family)